MMLALSDTLATSATVTHVPAEPSFAWSVGVMVFFVVGMLLVIRQVLREEREMEREMERPVPGGTETWL